MKKIIRLSESQLVSLIEKVIKEQPAFGQEKTKETESALEEQIFELERIQYDLKQTLKELEQDKNIAGGKLIPRIKNWLTKNRLKKENQEIAKRIEQTQRDIETYNSGKLLSDSEKKALLARVGAVIAAIGAFIVDTKTNFIGKTVSSIKDRINRD
jgi:hypothetical protein